jgi:hypothetical protein
VIDLLPLPLPHNKRSSKSSSNLLKCQIVYSKILGRMNSKIAVARNLAHQKTSLALVQTRISPPLQLPQRNQIKNVALRSRARCWRSRARRRNLGSELRFKSLNSQRALIIRLLLWLLPLDRPWAQSSKRNRTNSRTTTETTSKMMTSKRISKRTMRTTILITR